MSAASASGSDAKLKKRGDAPGLAHVIPAMEARQSDKPWLLALPGGSLRK
jgi:hypothetical protein